MKLTEDKTYKINKVRVLRDSYYLFDLYNDIYILTQAPLFDDLFIGKEGTTIEVNGKQSLYVAKESRKSGAIVLINREYNLIRLSHSYKIIESKEEVIEIIN